MVAIGSSQWKARMLHSNLGRLTKARGDSPPYWLITFAGSKKARARVWATCFC